MSSYPHTNLDLRALILNAFGFPYKQYGDLRLHVLNVNEPRHSSYKIIIHYLTITMCAYEIRTWKS